MKKKFYFIPGLVSAFLFFLTGLNAAHLDGLWRNDRQNITIRIEQDQNGFRAKRIDQGVWYRYTPENEYVYIDRNGNRYEILDDDEIEWNEARTNKRIIFRRVDGRQEDRAERDNRSPRDWNHDRDGNNRWDERELRIEGRWYDRSSKERIIIEEIQRGYRVKTQHGAWEQYVADRRGRLKSRSGNTIQMIDLNTLKWKSNQGRQERIFIRQGNGHQGRKNNGHRNEERHSDKRGHKNCG